MGVKLWGAIAILFPTILFSQKDSTYIRTFPEKITFRAALLNTSNSFVFSDDAGNDIRLDPNKEDYLGLSILFRSAEIDVGFAPQFLATNRNNEASKLFTLNFRMFLGRWMQTLDFYQQQGFFATGNGQDSYIPQLKTLKIGGSTSYICNDRFSFRAIGFQNEWQRKSAGSFVPRLTTYYTRYTIPEALQSTTVTSVDIAIGPGYFYNWVPFEHFLLSGGATAGLGVNRTHTQDLSSVSPLYEATLRAVAGYNSERFFVGINTNYVFLEHDENRTTRVEDRLSFIEFYVGYRIDAPKKMMDWAKRFNETFNF